MCCGGGFPGGGGGGGGNLSGTLNPTFIPYASGAHTLSDSTLSFDDVTGDLYLVSNSFFIGTAISLDGPGQIITTEFLHVMSNTTLDGTTTMHGDLIINNGTSNVFTVDFSTGDTVLAGTLSIGEQATFGKSTVIPIVDAIATGGAGTYTVNIDAYLSDWFETAPGGVGTTTVAAPTNAAAGRRFMLRIQLGGSAASIIAFDAIYRFPSGAPSMDFSVTGYYYLGFAYNEHSNTWDAIGTLAGPFL